MPVSPNNLQFSLSSEYLDKLKALSKDGESLGLTAKRILIEALDGGEVVSSDYLLWREEINKDYDSRLTAVESSSQDLRNEVEGLRRVIYQLTSPVKKR